MTDGTRVIVRTLNGPAGKDGEVTLERLALERDQALADTTDVHGIPDTGALATYADVALLEERVEDNEAHRAATTNVHGIEDTAALLADVAAALPVHGYVGTGSLDAVTVPGIYRQHASSPATVANGYPVDGWPGVLEVLPYSSDGRLQRYTTERPEGGMWVRRLVPGVGWQPWDAYLPSRVDNTVGTRVLVGGVMVHGDTGWRRMDGALLNGWVMAHATYGPFVRRIGSTVHLVIRSSGLDGAAATDESFLTIPAGFVPALSANYRTAGSFGGAAGMTRIGYSAQGPGHVLQAVPGGRKDGALVWLTDDPWPTTLPGTPA